jgi:hypothetical protein
MIVQKIDIFPSECFSNGELIKYFICRYYPDLLITFKRFPDLANFSVKIV